MKVQLVTHSKIPNLNSGLVPIDLVGLDFSFFESFPDLYLQIIKKPAMYAMYLHVCTYYTKTTRN